MTLPIARLQTPARLFSVSESETEFGGIVRSKSPAGVVWGDFRPYAPQEVRSQDGDAYIAQAADFVCNAEGAMSRGHVLEIQQQEWTILSVDALPDGTVRVRIERVMS